MVSKILTEDERSRTSQKARKWYLPARLIKDHLPHRDLALHKVWGTMNYYKTFMGCMDKCEEASIHSNFNFKTLHSCTSVVEDKSC
ncbi:hypothetical protein LguiB_029335 [Lonicera macranthoides]